MAVIGRAWVRWTGDEGQKRPELSVEVDGEESRIDFETYVHPPTFMFPRLSRRLPPLIYVHPPDGRKHVLRGAVRSEKLASIAERYWALFEDGLPANGTLVEPG